jgi:hypothetical protein
LEKIILVEGVREEGGEEVRENRDVRRRKMRD